MRNRSENQIRLVLIRHGATEANRKHKYSGKTEESLSTAGIRDLHRKKDANAYPEIDCLFSSPMKRCTETAHIIYPDKATFIIPEWEEIDFGVFEGKNHAELKGNDRYQKWIDSNGTLPFPQGESREGFIERCKRGVERMRKQLAELPAEMKERDITAGLIIHGGTIMALLSSFCGGEYFDYQIANGEAYLCRMEESSGRFQLTILERIT